MKTRRTTMANIAWMIIALVIISPVLVSGAQGKKYPDYRVDGQELTPQEEYILAQSEKGEVADLLKQFVLPLIPEPDRRERAGKLGLTGYLEELDGVEKETLLKSYSRRYCIRPRFLEILLTEGFPGYKIRPHGEAFLISYGSGLRIRARFLEMLLTDGFPKLKIHYHGVYLRNAVISGQLNLRAAEISPEVILKWCVFQELNLRDSDFKKNLQILSSHIGQNANFLGFKVAKCAYFNDCIFDKEVNFNRAHIGEEFSVIGVKFLSANQAVHFDNLKVAKNALFERVVFHGPLNFRMAEIDGILAMRDAKFWGMAQFDSLKVAHSINFNRTEFEGDAHFPKLKVGNFADFRRAVFRGQAWFGGGDVGVDFRAPSARFLSPDKYASFFAMKVGREANFESAVFKGPVDFGSADFGVNLKASKASFENQSGNHPAIEAPDLKVGNLVDFTEANFKGRAIFAGTKVGGVFDASMARFESVDGVDFSGMKVGRFHADVEPGARFEGVQFRGPVSMAGGQFYDLTITGPDDCRPNLSHTGSKRCPPAITGTGPKDRRPILSQLNLDQVIVERNLKIQNVIVKKLTADSLQAKGQTNLAGLEIKEKANLNHSSFICLEMSKVKWPEPGREKVLLSGMSYQSMEIIKEDPRDNWLAKLGNWLHPTDALLDRIDDSNFDTRNYIQLQDLYQRTGQEELADQTYIKLKQREGGLDTWGSWLNPLNWPKLFFWDLAVGYGRKPLRILWSGLVIIAFGACFLDPEYLTDTGWVKKNKLYGVAGRLLLSWDMFTPSLLNLGMEKKWDPPGISGRLKFYILIHKLAGRVFIAVFLVGVWAKFK
jgi:uncharacterized protein YjbI with pentapeptide repeats